MRDGDILRGIRGATTVDVDTPDEIYAATTELMQELIERNALESRDIVSIFFTCTHDLVSAFPAVAARRLGLDDVPLICSQEIPVPGSLGMCVRVLLHGYVPRGRVVRHIYLREARSLRTDLVEDGEAHAST